MAFIDFPPLTKSSLNFLEEEKDRKLGELNGCFIFLHDKINEIHMRLGEQLVMLYDDCKANILNNSKELSELKATLAESEKQLKSNALQEVLEGVAAQLLKKIEEKESKQRQQMIPMMVINLDNRILNDMEEIYKIEKVTPYSKRSDPIWSFGSEGNQGKKGSANSPIFSYPQDISLDESKREIYIVDKGNYKVQVCSFDGNYIRSIENPDMFEPTKICNSYDFIYLTQRANRMILRYDKNNIQLINSILLNFSPSGVFCHNSNLLYVCDYERPRIHVLTPDLTQLNPIQLNSECFVTNQQFDNTHTESVHVTSTELWVLFSDCKFPLQSFSSEGVFLKCILSEDKIDRALYFCLDSVGNILVSDFDANRIKVFSINGESLTTIGRDGQAGSGDIFHPQGIAVTKNYNIVLVDWKQNHFLQFY